MESPSGSPSISRSFWAVELVPGKEYTTTPSLELKLSHAVLPASAKDKERTVVSLTCPEEGKTEEEAKPFAIASLRLDHAESQSLDISLDAGAPIILTVSGKNSVHLSGYYIPPQEEYDYDSDEEGFGMEDDEEISSQDEDDEGDELEAQIQQQLAKRKAQDQNGAPAKKAKQESQPQQPQKQKQQQQTPKQEGKQQKQTTPKQEGGKQEGGKQEGKQQTPKQNQNQQKGQQQKAPETRTLQGGLQVTTMEAGDGKEARKGDKVFVKYVGRLTKNGKVFDKSVNKTFSFGLGRREVITGWDMGVSGMKVGEKRRLVIPSELGYGSSGAPPSIPPNASLTFDIELCNVK